MHFKRYLQILLTTIMLLAIPCVLNALFLYATGEFFSAEKIAGLQTINQNVLASCATHDLSYPYKLARYQTQKPEIVAIGSSRVMPFREAIFNVKFFNMSRAMNSIDQGHFLINEVLQIHKPRIVILGLDFWWFVGPVQQNINYYKPPKDSNNPSIKLFLQPYIWLYQRKISWRYYWDTILKPIRPKEFIGVNAQIKKEGYAADGSFYHTSTVTGTHPSIDLKLNTTLRQIDEGKGLFPHNQKIEPIYISRLLQILKNLEEAGVKTYIFIPPMAPSAINQMALHDKEYRYIQDLKRELLAKGLVVYDFHNPKDLQTSDCEFIDGYHGGDIIYLKMLQQMAKDDPSKILKQYLKNIDISVYQNHAFFPNKQITRLPEVDFLKLGCKKNNNF